MPRTALADPPSLAHARHRCQAALQAAKEADEALSGLWHRYYRETLDQVRRQPSDRAATMLLRMAILFEVVADRRGWPERMR
jgi:hypothetical protein